MEWTKLVFQKHNVLTFLPQSSFCDLFIDVSLYLGANNIWKYLCEFFQHNTNPEKNCRKYGEISQVLVQDRLGLHKIFEKISQNSFFQKFLVRIYTKFWIKHDKFQVKRTRTHLGKISNSFTHKRTFLSALIVMNKNLLRILWDESGAQISYKTQ